MWIKVFVIVVMAAVLFSLFSALYQLVKGGEGHSQRTLKFLIWRLVFSIVLFIGLYVLAALGYLEPHGFSHATLGAPTASSATSAP